MSLASILDFLVHVKQVQSSRQVCIKAHGSRQPMRGGYVRKAGQWKRVGLCVAIATSPPHYRHCPREKRDGHQPPPPSIGLMTRSLTSISSSTSLPALAHSLPTHPFQTYDSPFTLFHCTAPAPERSAITTRCSCHQTPRNCQARFLSFA